MELHEYVTETLKQIINGVKTAQDLAKESGAQINPVNMEYGNYGEPIKHRHIGEAIYQHGQMVEFDVAVTITEDGQANAGIGVFVGPIGAGTQAQTGTSNIAVNKIKFSIPIFLPEQKNR